MGKKSKAKGCVRTLVCCWFLLMGVLLTWINLSYHAQYSAADGEATKSNTEAAIVEESSAEKLEKALKEVDEDAEPLGSSAPDSDHLSNGAGSEKNIVVPPPQAFVPTGALPPAPSYLPSKQSIRPGFESNSPREPPRPGDRDHISRAPPVMPGVDRDHLHGLIGRLPSGELRFPTVPMPSHDLSADEKRQAHRGQCFNAWKSDAISVDRKQPDVRSGECKQLHQSYPHIEALPTASIVFVFHNEIASVLIRSVHSVLNHSPPKLLHEIILVDDASTTDPTRFTEEQLAALQDKLVDYMNTIPKVRIVRLKERRGLMLARMEGAWRATGDVLIFLDSHIEATEGWMQPLLARIKQDPTHVVVPSIDSVDFDSFQFEGAGGGLGIVGFTWTLGQAPSAPQMTVEPQKSPIMAGGLFASDRAFFLHLGGYDPEMKFYGGEEMEIGFRTWQCGGDIEFIPCSHVYHVFRHAVFWQGTDSGGVAYKVPGFEITRNKLRTAAVWMDEYSKLVEYASPPLPAGMTLGNLEGRKQLRKKLQCKSFAWYLQKAAPGTFAPESKGMKAGALMNPLFKACLDTLGGSEPGLYPCHGQHGTQGFVLDGRGLVRVPLKMYEQCLAVGHGHLRGDTKVVMQPCPEGSGGEDKDATWTLTEKGQFASRSGYCLMAVQQQTQVSPYTLKVTGCEDRNERQHFDWMPW